MCVCVCVWVVTKLNTGIHVPDPREGGGGQSQRATVSWQDKDSLGFGLLSIGFFLAPTHESPEKNGTKCGSSRNQLTTWVWPRVVFWPLCDTQPEAIF